MVCIVVYTQLAQINMLLPGYTTKWCLIANLLYCFLVCGRQKNNTLCAWVTAFPSKGSSLQFYVPNAYPLRALAWNVPSLIFTSVVSIGSFLDKCTIKCNGWFYLLVRYLSNMYINRRYISISFAHMSSMINTDTVFYVTAS